MVELYDDHEQSERVRSWLQEYGMSIVFGLGLAFAGIFGYRYWENQQQVSSRLAADFYTVIQREVQAGQLDFAQEQYQALRESAGKSAYVGLAAMQLAGAYVGEGRLEPAADLYRDLLADRRLDALHPIVTLRLAQLHHAQGDYAEALALLDAAPPTGFRGAWAEVRGDVWLARGDLAQARQAYREALDHLTGQGAGRSLIQLKLDATGLEEEADETAS